MNEENIDLRFAASGEREAAYSIELQRRRCEQESAVKRFQTHVQRLAEQSLSERPRQSLR